MQSNVLGTCAAVIAGSVVPSRYMYSTHSDHPRNVAAFAHLCAHHASRHASLPNGHGHGHNHGHGHGRGHGRGHGHSHGLGHESQLMVTTMVKNTAHGHGSWSRSRSAVAERREGSGDRCMALCFFWRRRRHSLKHIDTHCPDISAARDHKYQNTVLSSLNPDFQTRGSELDACGQYWSIDTYCHRTASVLQ
eukprot:3775427-Rhodomonas_salina.3